MRYANLFLCSPAAGFGKAPAAAEVPAAGIEHRTRLTAVAVPAHAVQLVGESRSVPKWTRATRDKRAAGGVRVEKGPELEVTNVEVAGSVTTARTFLIVGSRNAILTALFGPQDTGYRLEATEADLFVEGLRKGVRRHVERGGHLDLDPATLLPGCHWTVTRRGHMGRYQVTVDNATVELEIWRPEGNDGAGAWEPLGERTPLQETARIRPASGQATT